MNYSDIYKPEVRSLKEEERPMDGLTQYVYVAPKAHRVMDLARVMEGSAIGYNIILCSNCHGRVDTRGEKDRYCRHCGYRLENLYGRP